MRKNQVFKHENSHAGTARQLYGNKNSIWTENSFNFEII